MIYSCSHDTTLKIVKEVKIGDLSMPKRLQKATKKFTKESFVEIWLDNYFSKVADIQPDSYGRETLHLPAWMTHSWLFNLYDTDPVTCMKGMYKNNDYQ